MRHNLDQSHVVKFYELYHMNQSTGLVMELLDKTLNEYMQGQRLPLADIRLFVQQVCINLLHQSNVNRIQSSGPALTLFLTRSWPQPLMD